MENVLLVLHQFRLPDTQKSDQTKTPHQGCKDCQRQEMATINRETCNVIIILLETLNLSQITGLHITKSASEEGEKQYQDVL